MFPFLDCYVLAGIYRGNFSFPSGIRCDNLIATCIILILQCVEICNYLIDPWLYQYPSGTVFKYGGIGI